LPCSCAQPRRLPPGAGGRIWNSVSNPFSGGLQLRKPIAKVSRPGAPLPPVTHPLTFHLARRRHAPPAHPAPHAPHDSRARCLANRGNRHYGLRG
jgi:hypothetical protein